MAKVEQIIKLLCAEYRPCFVEGKKALFHRWTEKKEIAAPSLMRGGHSGGQLQQAFGIVEYEDGSVAEVYPHKIKFVPGKMNQYSFPEERSEEPRTDKRGSVFEEKKVWCPYCKGENATVCKDTTTKEIFVYCQKCGIETLETFKSQERALNAFAEGKTRSINQQNGGSTSEN